MNEHALDAMIYAWMVMKEKEESSMEGIFMGQIVGSTSNVSKSDGKRGAQVYFHDTESNACSKLSHYNKTYSLVLSDEVITTNDELLKLREKVAELEEELIEIKTTRTLREAYITGVEKGCESLREEVAKWRNRCNSNMTDISNALSANGIELTIKDVTGDVNWKLGFDIPELNEAKKEITELKRKLKAVESKETYWRDRKEEEEDYHHYWVHTFDLAVKQAADKGIYIDVRGTDEDCNAGVVVVDNVKAEELKSQVVQMEDANQKLRQRISAADEEIEKLKSQHTSRSAMYWRNTYYSAVEKAKAEGITIAVQGSMDLNADIANLKVTNEKAIELMVKVSDTKHEYNKKWQAMLNALKDKGVEVIYMGEEDEKPVIDIKVPGWEKDKQWVRDFSKHCGDLRADIFQLERERDELKEKCDILRKDGVLKGQQCLKLKADLNDLKKEYGRVLSELAELKSKTVAEARYEWKPGCFTMIYTMCDGSKQTTGADLSHEHINCLCKNYVPVHEGIDATAISCGTVPKCSSCSHFMHNPSRFAHDWCYMPCPKDGGAGYIRKLNKEEAEGPACSDFKARKE